MTDLLKQKIRHIPVSQGRDSFLRHHHVAAGSQGFKAAVDSMADVLGERDQLVVGIGAQVHLPDRPSPIGLAPGLICPQAWKAAAKTVRRYALEWRRFAEIRRCRAKDGG
jgi:hypothetical protein